MNLLEIVDYSWIPISQTLVLANLPITRTKIRFPSLVKHCIFTLGFSKSPISPQIFFSHGGPTVTLISGQESVIQDLKSNLYNIPQQNYTLQRSARDKWMFRKAKNLNML